MDTKTILKKVPIFSSLDDEELTIIQNYCVQQSLQENEKLFDYGQDFKHLCIVASGSIAIFSNGSAPRLIARYLPDESFGELNLCGIALGNNQAVAMEVSSVMLFPSIPFEDFIITHASLGAKIIYTLLSNISFRIRETNKLISQNYGWVSELKKAIYTDRLTGFYNRQYIDELIKEAKECVIAVIKPDKFKTINDTCGHKAGDATLIALAQTIRKVSPNATHIRYRGDEFLVVTQPDISIQTFASSILAAIQSINMPLITDGAIQLITASVGVCRGTLNQQLIDSAYECMWSSYHQGGNMYTVEGNR